MIDNQNKRRTRIHQQMKKRRDKWKQKKMKHNRTRCKEKIIYTFGFRSCSLIRKIMRKVQGGYQMLYQGRYCLQNIQI